jgi:type I restriction enzyme M protein
MKRMKNKEATPQYIKENGKFVLVRREGIIWSPLRQIWLVETPEESVRQEFLCVLVNEYAYKPEQIAEEMEVTGRGAAKARADFVIWRTPLDKTDKKSPLIIV